MSKIISILLLALLLLSLSLNLFQWSNTEVTCSNIDKSWKAELLYKLWHRNLDWDKDGSPCEHLQDYDIPWDA